MAKPVPKPLVVSEILKQVWHTFQEYQAHFVRLMFIAGTLLALFVGIVFLRQPSLQPGQTPNISAVAGMMFFGLLFALVSAVVLLMLVVACHRCVLLAERKMEFAEWSTRILRYAWRAFLVALVSSIPAILLTLFAGPLLIALVPKNPNIQSISPTVVAGMFLATFVMYIPTTYVAGRLSLVLPAIAVDRELTLTESVSLTEGNGWRMAILTGLIPVGIPLALKGAIAFGVGQGTSSASVALAWGVFDCYFQAAYFMATAVILSTCFRELSTGNLQPRSSN